MSKLTLRAEKPGDFAGVRRVNLAAFETPVEADLVDFIRTTGHQLVSLVALDSSTVVGHIFFTPITLESHNPITSGMALGPMAILPEYQKKGIGSALIELGLAVLSGRKCPFVIVLGHPKYYPRFGFMPAHLLGILCQWPDVPKEAFMVLVLDDRVAGKLSGLARYLPEFDRAV